jgi:hypothetical protein
MTRIQIRTTTVKAAMSSFFARIRIKSYSTQNGSSTAKPRRKMKVMAKLEVTKRGENTNGTGQKNCNPE